MEPENKTSFLRGEGAGEMGNRKKQRGAGPHRAGDVGAAGNEGIAGHHISGVIPEQSRRQDIELKIAEGERGCCVEI